MIRIFVTVFLLTGSAAAADIAAGWNHSVALKDGRVWSWGDNSDGQLGQPDAGRALRPRPVPGLTGVIAVTASRHTLALTAEGGVYAWGRNNCGQIGNGCFGLDQKQSLPVKINGLADIVAVAAGWEHSLALSRSGNVYAWGSRSHGELGDAIRKTGQPSAIPAVIPGLKDIVAIAAGGGHSLALKRDGTLYAWGSNWNGQLGNGKNGKETHSSVPKPVIGPDGKGVLKSVCRIAAGAKHSVAVTKEGLVYAWGYNGTGQVPTGKRGGFWGTAGTCAVSVPELALVEGSKGGSVQGSDVAAGYESTYVLDDTGKLLSSGWSMYGELGSGSSGRNRDTLGSVLTGKEVLWKDPSPGVWRPSLICRYTDPTHRGKGVENVEVVDLFKGTILTVGDRPASGSRSCNIKRNAGYVEIEASMITPLQAKAGLPVSSLFTKLMFGSGAVDDDFATDVRLRWTNAESGESVDIPLGAGEHVASDVLPPLGSIVTIAAGMHHMLARDSNGELWACGHNGFGQLGNGGVSDGIVAQKLDLFDESTQPLPPVQQVVQKADAAPPEGKIIDVRKYGVKGDGITLDQRALQLAINECGKQGGGIVWLPPGTYLSGMLELRNGVRLHLNAGATILASTNKEHFPGKALIKATGLKNIGITGRGVLDGQGCFTGARGLRHNCIYMENCRDVLVEGISTINAGAWTEHYIRCIGLTIRDVTVCSLLPGRNNDGIDLSGCEDVRIEGCTVISDDDAIVIKSQSAERVNRNIEVTGNTCHTYRGAFKLGTESRGRYENIVCRDLTCYGSKALELYSVDGSESSNIVIENVKAYDALIALNIRLGARLRSSYWTKGVEPKPGCLRKISIKNVEVEIGNKSWREILLEHGIPGAEWANGKPEAPYDSCISGLPGHLVEDVVIENMKVRVQGGEKDTPDIAEIPENPDIYPHGGNFGVLPAYGLFIRHAKNVALRNAVFETIQPDARPPVASLDAPGLVGE